MDALRQSIMRAQLESRQRAARLKVYGWFVLAVAVLGTAIYSFSRAHSGGLVGRLDRASPWHPGHRQPRLTRTSTHGRARMVVLQIDVFEKTDVIFHPTLIDFSSVHSLVSDRLESLRRPDARRRGLRQWIGTSTHLVDVRGHHMEGGNFNDV